MRLGKKRLHGALRFRVLVRYAAGGSFSGSDAGVFATTWALATPMRSSSAARRDLDHRLLHPGSVRLARSDYMDAYRKAWQWACSAIGAAFGLTGPPLPQLLIRAVL